MHTAIERGCITSGLREPRRRTALRSRLIVDAAAAANTSLVPDPVGHADARRDVGPIGVVEPAGLAAHAGKQESAIEDRGWRWIRIRRCGVGFVVGDFGRGPSGDNLVTEGILDRR